MSKTNERYSNQLGFSLLEILIAITVLSFLMLGILSLTDTTFDTADRVISEDRETLQLETAMSRIEWDFSQIYSPLYFAHAMDPQHMTEEEGQLYNQLADYYQNHSRFSFLSYDGQPVPLMKNPDKSTFVFFTTSNRRKIQNVKQSHFAWVKYSLVSSVPGLEEDEDENENGETEKKGSVLIRQMMADNVFSPEEIRWDDVKTQVLMRKVIKLTFEFWNEESQKWVENLDVIKNGNNLIRGMRLKMNYYDATNIEQITVRVFRPLFPSFAPEDMYKFLKATTGNATDGAEGVSGAGADSDE